MLRWDQMNLPALRREYKKLREDYKRLQELYDGEKERVISLRRKLGYKPKKRFEADEVTTRATQSNTAYALVAAILMETTAYVQSGTLSVDTLVMAVLVGVITFLTKWAQEHK